MMSNRVVLLENHLDELRRCVFDRPGVEGAAFVLCGQSISQRSTKLISHTVVRIADDDYARREKYGLTITSRALARISKLARHEHLSILFAHSHPDGMPEFSEQDDREESVLMPFFSARVPDRVHGTLVLTENSIVGRLYMPNRTKVEQVLVVGNQIKTWSSNGNVEVPSIFDRQVRAFGGGVQQLLKTLKVGIVGLGGTGSPLAEQLCRLGVGELVLFDGDTFEPTNVNRVYGSRLQDAGALKVNIAKRNLEQIGIGTTVFTIPTHITFEESARALRECDILFGCTDKQLPRAILSQLAIKYSIPVFDLGVLIDSEAGQIKGVHGRVTTVMAGEACLFCRGRISPEGIRIEALSTEERSKQAAEGYAPELDDPAPAVIAFTTAIASAAVSEFLHRLTAFMGKERNSTEVLYAFDENRIRTNRVSARESCVCTDVSTWGRGDEEPFLNMMWASHTK